MGLLGYFGTAGKISRMIRCLIIVVFVVFYATLILAFLDSMQIHNALHIEIKDYIALHQDEFINKTD